MSGIITDFSVIVPLFFVLWYDILEVYLFSDHEGLFENVCCVFHEEGAARKEIDTLSPDIVFRRNL